MNHRRGASRAVVPAAARMRSRRRSSRPGAAAASEPKDVVLVTHDSFAVSRSRSSRRSSARAASRCGSSRAATRTRCSTVRSSLRATRRATSSSGSTTASLSRALAGDLLEEYRSPELSALQPDFVESRSARDADRPRRGVPQRTTAAGSPRTRSLRRRPSPTSSSTAYRNLLVVENPATSSPGLAFLLATVATYGDPGWEAYWRALRANGVLVVDGWEEAYTQQFSGASGSPRQAADRRVVRIEPRRGGASSRRSRPVRPPRRRSRTGCYRQVEYAGVLRGAHNEDGAHELIDFMLSERFQADVPGSMFVYPVRHDVPLPDAFVKHAIVPRDPLRLPAAEIDANRDRWVARWTEIVVR